MASTARSAPLPESRSLLDDPQFQDILHGSRSLTQKILLSVPDTHRSCIHAEETFKLSSSGNSNLSIMASKIGLPPAVGPIPLNLSLEDSLRQMCEGLKLHQALLSSITPHLEMKDKVTDLNDDIRDLIIQTLKMLKKAQTEAKEQPAAAPVDLRLPGNYEVQVAAHLTLVQLQSFITDMNRVLREWDRSDQETEAES